VLMGALEKHSQGLDKRVIGVTGYNNRLYAAEMETWGLTRSGAEKYPDALAVVDCPSRLLDEYYNQRKEVIGSPYYEPDAAFSHLGCYKDTSDRAMDHLKDGINSIEGCYDLCKENGYSLFGLQHPAGGECFCSNDKDEAMQFGKATNCEDGRGGDWALDIYETNDENCVKWKDIDNMNYKHSMIPGGPGTSNDNFVYLGTVDTLDECKQNAIADENNIYQNVVWMKPELNVEWQRMCYGNIDGAENNPVATVNAITSIVDTSLCF